MSGRRTIRACGPTSSSSAAARRMQCIPSRWDWKDMQAQVLAMEAGHHLAGARWSRRRRRLEEVDRENAIDTARAEALDQHYRTSPGETRGARSLTPSGGALPHDAIVPHLDKLAVQIIATRPGRVAVLQPDPSALSLSTRVRTGSFAGGALCPRALPLQLQRKSSPCRYHARWACDPPAAPCRLITPSPTCAPVPNHLTRRRSVPVPSPWTALRRHCSWGR
jgi:hypothetical protein